jgi:serine phosphatase RsbU (regulator of sigma subunit)
VIPESVLAIAPGDFALLASDGIIDQRRHDGTPYGVERLLAALAQRPVDGATNLITTVYSAVREFAGGAPQDDDQTGLAMFLAGPVR